MMKKKQKKVIVIYIFITKNNNTNNHSDKNIKNNFIKMFFFLLKSIFLLVYINYIQIIIMNLNIRKLSKIVRTPSPPRKKTKKEKRNEVYTPKKNELFSFLFFFFNYLFRQFFSINDVKVNFVFLKFFIL